MARFPARTLVLMVLTLATIGWLWWQTHQARSAAGPVRATLVGPLLEVQPQPSGGDQ
jgi:hypothetical protein